MNNENAEKLVDELPTVENVMSNNGNKVPNQFIITGVREGKEFILFQSYKSPIALIQDGEVYIFSDWDYSTTTGKYRNDFLRETKKETLEKLKSGEYIAVGFEVKK